MPELAFYFGKYKDIPISQINDVNWLEFALSELIMDHETRKAVAYRLLQLSLKELQK